METTPQRNDDFQSRIDRLTERHEALTQSCELLLAESRLHSQQLQRDGENILAMLRIAELHHERLVRLEGGPV